MKSKTKNRRSHVYKSSKHVIKKNIYYAVIETTCLDKSTVSRFGLKIAVKTYLIAEE